MNIKRCLYCDKRVMSYAGGDGLQCIQTEKGLLTGQELYNHLMWGTRLVGCDEYKKREKIEIKK